MLGNVTLSDCETYKVVWPVLLTVIIILGRVGARKVIMYVRSFNLWLWFVKLVLVIFLMFKLS